VKQTKDYITPTENGLKFKLYTSIEGGEYKCQAMENVLNVITN